MMERLLARGERLARDAEQRQVVSTAQQLRTRFGSEAVTVEGSRVLVRGRGLLRRWLVEPGLRFLIGASR